MTGMKSMSTKAITIIIQDDFIKKLRLYNLFRVAGHRGPKSLQNHKVPYSPVDCPLELEDKTYAEDAAYPGCKTQRRQAGTL